MPPMPPIPGAPMGAGFSSFFSTRTHSVVRNMDATDAAFSRATRDTLVGSMMPAANMFFINIVAGVVTEIAFTFAHLLNHYRTFAACIGYDLTERLLYSAF